MIFNLLRLLKHPLRTSWITTESLGLHCRYSNLCSYCQLVASGNWQGIEPYLSMTLRRIQQPWANELLAQVTAAK